MKTVLLATFQVLFLLVIASPVLWALVIKPLLIVAVSPRSDVLRIKRDYEGRGRRVLNAIRRGTIWGSRSMLYWLTETAASSFRLYNANAMQPPTIKGRNTRVPVAVATEAPIPGGVRLPREWADRQTAGNVVQFHDMEGAGHFAAWEDPQVYVKDLKSFALLLA